METNEPAKLTYDEIMSVKDKVLAEMGISGEDEPQKFNFMYLIVIVIICLILAVGVRICLKSTGILI